MENKQDSYLGKVGQATAPIFAPLGFGTWEASASLITGVIAKEIVVSTMAVVYVPESAADEQEEESPTFLEDVKEIGVSFVGAIGEGARNVFSTFGIATISAEEEEDAGDLRAIIAGAFTPLSAYAFMVFVLLYMPCVIVLIAMRQEFGTWKWAGIAVLYQTVLAWSAALIVYQAGRWMGF